MGHFRGYVRGNRDSEASRLGTKSSGLFGRINGWDIGCDVELTHDSELDRDKMEVTITKGSNNSKTIQRMTFYEKDGKIFQTVCGLKDDVELGS